MRTDQLDPDEKRVVTFDFSGDLDPGETLTGTINTSVFMMRGIDAAPSSVLNGLSRFDDTNKKVFVPVKGGINDRDYGVKVVVGTTTPEKVLALVACIPIRQ